MAEHDEPIDLIELANELIADGTRAAEHQAQRQGMRDDVSPEVLIAAGHATATAAAAVELRRLADWLTQTQLLSASGVLVEDNVEGGS